MTPVRRAAIALAFGALALAGASVTLGQGEGAQPPPDELARGHYLAILGDCAGCHTRPGGAEMAGGLPLSTSFGVIYSANITSDRSAGIGGWTEPQFYQAMHTGKDDQGAHLYPAFPYPYFTRMPRTDVDALWAYLRTVPASSQKPPPNKLGFPYNIRALIAVWNWLYLKPGDFQPSADRDAAWNRGAYIVTGPGHCGACHSPKGLLGGDDYKRALQGGLIDNWYAPDLTSSPHGGLADWTRADIAEFLKTGRNQRAGAAASMAPVVQHSTSQMNDADLGDVAEYLKSLPAARQASAERIDPGVMAAGAAIYRDQCSACHQADGSGVSREFPTLAGSALLQSQDPTTVDRYILTGTQVATTAARPTNFAMPAFAWKLSDGQIADVATYVRNSWGNVAPTVSAGQVAKLRRAVASQSTRPPPSPA